MAATPDLAGRESPGEGPLFEADFISQGHHLLYRHILSCIETSTVRMGWTSIALILAHGVSQPLLKTTLRFQIQIVTQSGDESSAKTKFIKVSETCIFYIGTLGLIDWTSGSRRDKT